MIIHTVPNDLQKCVPFQLGLVLKHTFVCCLGVDYICLHFCVLGVSWQAELTPTVDGNNDIVKSVTSPSTGSR